MIAWKRLIAIVILFLPACGWADPINVSAASSLNEVLNDIAQNYRADTGDKIDLNFGASGTLAAQIQQGAPVDLFISAAAKPVDDLIAAGQADRSTRREIAGNRLVLIVPRDSAKPPAKFEDLSDGRFHHIAIGEPKAVPAGQYAMQTFKALHIDKGISDRLVMGENVRQVLIYVTRGEADAGVVYSTDAKAAGDAVKVVATAAESTHDPIVYPAIVVRNGKQAAAEKFLEYLRGEKARASFVERGFSIPGSAPSPAASAPASRESRDR
jgi:molybdate transport system substrate-binding protein